MTRTAHVSLPKLECLTVGMLAEPATRKPAAFERRASNLRAELNSGRLGGKDEGPRRWATAEWFDQHYATAGSDAAAHDFMDPEETKLLIEHMKQEAKEASFFSDGFATEDVLGPVDPHSIRAPHNPYALLPVERRVRSLQVLSILYDRIGRPQFLALADAIGKNLPLRTIGSDRGMSNEAAAHIGRERVVVALDSAYPVKRRIADWESREEPLPEGLLQGYTLH